MNNILPSWFAADQMFDDTDGWYIGSPDGFRVGPYPRRAQAERHSKSLLAKLERCSSTAERVRVVRAFLREQNARDGRQLRSGPAAGTPAVVGKAQPPQVRAGESPKVWFRTNRFFAVGDVWFFSTRENVDVGPYATRAEAERDAARLLEILRQTESPAECRLAIMQFQWRPRMSSAS